MTLQEFVVSLGFDVDEQGLNKVKEAMSIAANAVKNGIQKINQSAEKIKEFVNKIKQSVKDGMKHLGDSFKNIPIVKGLTSVFNKAKSVAQNGVAKIRAVMNKIGDIRAKINANPIVQGFKAAMNKTVDIVKAGGAKIKAQLAKISASVKVFGGRLKESMSATLNPEVFAIAAAGIAAIGVATGKVVKDFLALNRETYASDKALEILGKTMEEVQADPELLKQFNELKATADSMKLPPALPESAKLIQDIIKQVNILRMTFDVFLKWVGYYLLKYLDKPLKDIKAGLGKMNEFFKNNIEDIAKNVAKVVTKIITVIMHVIQFFIKFGQVIGRVLDKVPDQIKKIVGALTLLFILFKKNPFVMILTIIIALIDDFMTYLEGGESALGGFWKILIDGWKSFDGSGIIQKVGKILQDFIKLAVQGFKDLIKWIKDIWKWMKESGTLGKLKTAFVNTFKGIFKVIMIVIDIVKKLWKWLDDNQVLTRLGQIIVSVFTTAIDIISKVIGWIVQLWNKISESGALDRFLAAAGNVFKFIVDAIQGIIKWFTDLFDSVSDGGDSSFGSLIDIVGDFINVVLDLISTVANLLVGFLQLDSVQAVFKAIGDIISGVVKLAIDSVISTFNVLKGIVDVILKLIQGDFAGAFKSAADTISSYFSGVINMFNNLKNLIGDILGGIGNIAKGVASDVGNFFTGGGKETKTSKGHADGGIFNQEHIAPFAEGNKAEAVIPLEGKNKNRGISIATKVNEMLGINQPDFSGITDMINKGANNMINAVNTVSAIMAKGQSLQEQKAVNNKIINNTPQISIQVNVSLSQTDTRNPVKIGEDIGAGLKQKLVGIMMDNRQGATA